MDVLGVFREAFGVGPAGLELFKGDLTSADLESFLQVRERWSLEKQIKKPATNEIWPLISHHRFNPLAVFGPGRRDADSAVLSMLLAFNGLVVSDPTVEVVRASHDGSSSALNLFRQLTANLAGVERLVDAGVVRFTGARPQLGDWERADLLNVFGLSPDLKVFTNFIEAYDHLADIKSAVPEVAQSVDLDYVAQARELFRLFGMSSIQMLSPEAAVEAVEALGQAVIHLSWELGVLTADSSADLVVSNSLERALLNRALEAGTEYQGPSQGAAATRHLQRSMVGDIPNFSGLNLSQDDALKIRTDDSFELFRAELTTALDHLDGAMVGDAVARAGAEREFSAQMMSASARLRATPGTSPWKRSLGGASITAAVATFATAASGHDVLTTIFGATVGAAAIAGGELVRDRVMSGAPGRKIAVRHATLLGGAARD